MRIADCGLRIADCGLQNDLTHIRKFAMAKLNGRKVTKASGHFSFRVVVLRMDSQINPQSAIRNPQSLLLRGLRGLRGFEEFVDSILIDFDLALIFVSFAGGFDERLEGQVLTFVEDVPTNAFALLREF